MCHQIKGKRQKEETSHLQLLSKNGKSEGVRGTYITDTYHLNSLFVDVLERL